MDERLFLWVVSKLDLCDIRVIRALLARHEKHFSKAKGQNFLCEARVPAEIADLSGADETFGVLEVGPGIGCLTAELCAAAGKVLAVEVDEALRPILAETMADRDNLELLFGDILRQDIPALVREHLPMNLDVAGVVKDERIVPAQSYDPSAFLRDLSGVLYWAERILHDEELQSDPRA